MAVAKRFRYSRGGIPKILINPDAVAGAAQPPYELSNIHVEFVRVEPPGISTSLWRGVGPTHNIFVVESFIDELAHTAKRDPVEYRKSLLAHNQRALGVLMLQSNFNDYRPTRMNEAPIVETHVVQSSEPPGGVGEVPTATVSPAVANAIFAATGKRIRKLPIKGLDAVR